MKTIAAKMGIRPKMRAIFIQAPAAIAQTIQLPAVILEENLTNQFDYIHLFAKNQAELSEQLPHLIKHLNPNGMLWVSWQKGKQNGTDLSLPTVIKIGYDHDLVESKTLSIDSTWSAMKFTFPKPGKVYKNSYGKLKSSSS